MSACLLFEWRRGGIKGSLKSHLDIQLKDFVETNVEIVYNQMSNKSRRREKGLIL